MKNIRRVTIPKNAKVTLKREPGRIEYVCNHKWSGGHLLYLDKLDWGEKRTANGEKQTQCPHCKLWCFPEELE